MTERETLLAEIAERQARLAELGALDPLLIEAREIAARCSLFPARIARDYLGGEMDKGPLVTSVLAALRRGMELAKAPPMGSVMGEAEIWTLARQCAADYYRSIQPGLATNMRAGFCDDQPSVVSALAAIRETLSRVQPRWPSEAELEEMAHVSSQSKYSPHAAALEMARRIRTYQTGQQP